MNDATDLLERKWSGGTRVTNCLYHSTIRIDLRPDSCDLCLADLRNQFRYALRVNEWLNKWKEDAEAALRQSVIRQSGHD